MTLAIRPATLADADATIAVWHACELTRPWNDPQADFARAVAWPGSTVLLGEIDGAAVATAMAGFDGHRGWLYYLGVLPAWRGRGFGGELVEASCDWLRAQGCPKVELMVREGNPAAGLYERLAWELQPVRTYGRWLDA